VLLESLLIDTPGVLCGMCWQESGMTALMAAAKMGQLDVVKILLRYGAETMLKNSVRVTTKQGIFSDPFPNCCTPALLIHRMVKLRQS
jgi:hypothetical protein